MTGSARSNSRECLTRVATGSLSGSRRRWFKNPRGSGMGRSLGRCRSEVGWSQARRFFRIEDASVVDRHHFGEAAAPLAPAREHAPGQAALGALPMAVHEAAEKG